MGNRELLFTEYTVFVGDEEKVLDIVMMVTITP